MSDPNHFMTTMPTQNIQKNRVILIEAVKIGLDLKKESGYVSFTRSKVTDKFSKTLILGPQYQYQITKNNMVILMERTKFGFVLTKMYETFTQVFDILRKVITFKIKIPK